MSVYFITAREVDLVKIGCAVCPVARFRCLQVASPIELALEGAIPGDFEKERELHARYAKWRVRGEWFSLVPSVEAEIEASTRPEKFTWGAVRKWRNTLSRQSLAMEPAAPELRQDLERCVEAELREKLNLSALRRGMTEIQRREADGDIHFPFRTSIRA